MIKDMVNESVIVAIRDGRDMVTWPDVLEAKAFKIHGLADGPAAMELEQLETALHEAGHAVAGYLLQRRWVIDIATIEQRGSVGGFVSSVPVEERKFHWRSEMENDVIVSLASLAAERIFFEDDNSGGVGGDMGNATNLVRTMLSRWAMGQTLTSHVTNPATQGLGSTNDDLSDAQREEFDRRVEAKLQELFDRTHKLMYDNRWFLAAIAHALQAHKTITGEDIDAIYKGGRGPTLDGAVYRSEAFLQQYGAYLASAQEAHRTQGKVMVPLPRFELAPMPVPGIVDPRDPRYPAPAYGAPAPGYPAPQGYPPPAYAPPAGPAPAPPGGYGPPPTGPR
jgi:cell division protease FtsH